MWNCQGIRLSWSSFFSSTSAFRKQASIFPVKPAPPQGSLSLAEALRSGIESVSVSQYESAAALGLTEHQIFRFVVFPQAFTVSLPPLCANVLFLIKETSVFSVCAVPDLMYIAKDLIGLYYKTDETLWMLVISYLIILLPISAGSSLLERRLRHGPYRDTDPA